MMADFAVRLAGGLAGMLLLAPRPVVPLAFFRTHCLVILGLFVGAALAEGRSVPPVILTATIGGGVSAYLASALWGLGLPRLAVPATTIAFLVGLGLIVEDGHFSTSFGFFNAASRVASAALLGSSLSAMLLGHHYLTAPAMTIAPLRRYVLAMAIALTVRTSLAAVGLSLWLGQGPSRSVEHVAPLFLGMRWGMGVLGPTLATLLTWKTVQIRSTQSATGILYIAVTLVLFGELAGLILGRSVGIEF